LLRFAECHAVCQEQAHLRSATAAAPTAGVAPWQLKYWLTSIGQAGPELPASGKLSFEAEGLATEFGALPRPALSELRVIDRATMVVGSNGFYAI
jgi:hypothetical protein